MPKEKSSKSCLLKQWISGNQDYTTDGKAIFCQPCGKEIKCKKKFQIEQHSKTAAHVASKEKKDENVQQTLLTKMKSTTSASFNTLAADLCTALVCSNIPLKKLSNPSFRRFLEKYCVGQKIPDESTLRKKYLDVVYSTTLDNIRDDIGGNFVWISVDETTDACGRYIANLIVGKLSLDGPGTPHLLTSKMLERTNHSTIACFVNNSLKLLWPSGGNDDKVLLLLSDAAAYMLKAGSCLKVFYANLLHVTCFAHGLNRVAETARLQFSTTNTLISSVKKIFVKSPSRIQLYKNALPNVPLPPEPVLTRWGTWIAAAVFHAENYDTIKEVILTIESKDSAAIYKAQAAYRSETIRQELAMIQAHLSSIPIALTKLQTSGASLSESLEVIQKVADSLKTFNSEAGKKISSKLDDVLVKNPGYSVLCSVNGYLNGSQEPLSPEISPNIAAYLKYCPVTSVDVERSFSAYKLVLTDRRHNLLTENIEKMLVAYCFANFSKN